MYVTATAVHNRANNTFLSFDWLGVVSNILPKRLSQTLGLTYSFTSYKLHVATRASINMTGNRRHKPNILSWRGVETGNWHQQWRFFYQRRASRSIRRFVKKNREIISGSAVFIFNCRMVNQALCLVYPTDQLLRLCIERIEFNYRSNQRRNH